MNDERPMKPWQVFGIAMLLLILAIICFDPKCDGTVEQTGVYTGQHQDDPK